MRIFLSILFFCIVILFIGLYNKAERRKIIEIVKPVPAKKDDSYIKETIRLKGFGNSIKPYISQNGYNNNYCFLVDMKINSGKNRFFVYDLQKDSILKKGLVTHGSGSDKTDGLYFSNISGSNCTSLGRYKIGKPYNGTFGLAYKLYGLDKTNSNALNRFVVLHSHSCVPDNEVPVGICRSLGCPTVAPSYLQTLKNYIDKSDKPVLLWIFY